MRSSITVALIAAFVFSAFESTAQMPRRCCADLGMAFRIDFSDPNVQSYLGSFNNPLILFEIDDVNFSRVVDQVEYTGGSLEFNGGRTIGSAYHAATMRLDFASLQCLVCSVTGYANPHGAPAGATLEGNGFGRQNPISSSERGNRDVEMAIKTDAENPFCAVTFSGEELEIYAVQFE